MLPVFNNILVMGYGNIAQALSFSLRKRFPELAIHVLDETLDVKQQAVASEFNLSTQRCRVTQANYAEVLSPHTQQGSLILNLATSISSCDVLEWAQLQGAHYLDTSIDPWEYKDGSLHGSDNTNYAMREEVLALQRKQAGQPRPGPTAIVAHGANPGFASILVKQALIALQERHLQGAAPPATREDWGKLAEALSIRVIQVSERDTQHSDEPVLQGEFVNTWSVAGYIAEALQPAELGWGSHECDGAMAATVHTHETGCQSAAYLPHLGVHCKVRSWTPAYGEFVGNLISHNESISLADYFTLKSESSVQYRPTVYYAYHPCDLAVTSLRLLQNGTRDQVVAERVIKHEINQGIDELGVLLISDKYPSLWYGSQLSIERARAIAPHNNATSLQVVGSVMAALEWILVNPYGGIMESEYLDQNFIFERAKSYWEPLVMEFKDWHPKGLAANKTWTIDQFLLEIATA